MVKPGLSYFQRVTPGLTWSQLVKHGLTWLNLVSPGYTCFNLVTPGHTWSHLFPSGPFGYLCHLLMHDSQTVFALHLKQPVKPKIKTDRK